ncbi:MAG: hypothetical protein ACRDIC_19645 [bacterium]
MYAPTSNIYAGQPVAEFFDPDTTQRHALGTIVQAVDPFWGLGEFVYQKAAVAFAQRGRLCTVDATETNGMIDMPNTANLAYPLYWNLAAMAINEFGWFQSVGNIPAQTANSIAAGVAAGHVAGTLATNAAGKQVQGIKVIFASTKTFGKTNSITENGSKQIKVPDYNGWFVGIPLTGTGVGASALVTALNPNGREVSVDVASTASGTVTVTGTYTGFLWVYADHCTSQGAIT